MPPVESIILKTNAMVDEALSHLVHSWKNGMSQKQLLMQLQTVAGMYACQGVKRNGGHTDKGKRHQACCIAYRDVAVPGFLKWLAEEECELPPWLTKHHMGCSTMTGAGKKTCPRTEALVCCALLYLRRLDRCPLCTTAAVPNTQEHRVPSLLLSLSGLKFDLTGCSLQQKKSHGHGLDYSRSRRSPQIRGCAAKCL